MRLLYQPAVNALLRGMLRPFARHVPERYRFSITQPFRLRIDPDHAVTIVGNPTSYVSKALFWGGFTGYEYHVTPIYIELVRRAKVVLDIGASIGYYSLLAAVFNEKARIYSFEPLPAAYHYLLLNLEENGVTTVRAERLALSDQVGSARFFEAKNPKFLHLNHHLTGASSFDAPGAGYVQGEAAEVRTDTLDHYAAAHIKDRIDLIKIDAEASEHRILRGGAAVLREHRPVIITEVLPGRVEREMEVLFSEFGYVMYNARPDGLHRIDGLVGQNLLSHDFIMVPEGQEGQIRSFLAH